MGGGGVVGVVRGGVGGVVGGGGIGGGGGVSVVGGGHGERGGGQSVGRNVCLLPTPHETVAVLVGLLHDGVGLAGHLRVARGHVATADAREIVARGGV